MTMTRKNRKPHSHRASWAPLGAGTRQRCRVEIPKGSFTDPYRPCNDPASYVINEPGRVALFACCLHFQEWLDERKEKAR